MNRISVQVPQDLHAGLNDLARRERKDLQPMLREILQAVVDGDEPGRVVSAGTREAIDSLREELRRGEAARAQALMEAIESFRDDLLRGRQADHEVRTAQTAAFIDLLERVDRILELHEPSGHDESRQGRLGRILGGGRGR